MRIASLSLSSPDVRADVGFFQVLGYALCELEDEHARLVPASGPELWIEKADKTELKAVLSGMGPKQDPEGNPLLYATAPAATTRGQVDVLGPVYPVVDLPTSVAWYEKQLGLEEVFADEVTAWSELSDEAGQRMVLAFAPDLKTPAMLALLVRDAAAEVARLREFDLEPVWTRSVPWGRLAAYVAPGGLASLLVERVQ
jgi:catechol 2,3-dioxygenase-like lactoylglutathione lyase family enzyme